MLNGNDNKSDFKSGIVIFLIALPLCLGLSLASGFPLYSGIISGIIGGILVGLISNSHFSVSGPALGLVTIMTTAKMYLNDFQSIATAIFLAGLFQILLGILKSGMLAYYFPSNVLKAMMAAIGVLIIIKEIPYAFGIHFSINGIISLLKLNYTLFKDINFLTTFITIIGLSIMVYWHKIKLKYISSLPAAMVVVIFGVTINIVVSFFFPEYSLIESQLIHITSFKDYLESSKIFYIPNYYYLTNYNVLVYSLIFCAVLSIETLMSVEAIDNMDPKHRITNKNRELIAQGIANVLAGILGVLPISSVILRSSTNINNGAKGKLSTIIHGLLLLITFIFIPHILNLIPLSSLASILIFVGFKLAKPSLFWNSFKNGIWQFIPFAITFMFIIVFDLLIGILVGLSISIIFILFRNIYIPQNFIDKRFKKQKITKIEFNSELSFLNKAQIKIMFENIENNSKVVLDARKTIFIDHDVLDIIKLFIDKISISKNIELNLIGFRKGFGIKNTASIFDNILGKNIDEENIEIHQKELQQKITPLVALQLMKEGNFRFVNNLKINRDLIKQVNTTSEGQFPYVVVLSCIDSRTSAELIFDKGMGDLFSIRIAGNILNDDIIGSMEYSCKVVGSKLIVVLGHSKCGAIKGACDDIKLGFLTTLIEKIKPCVEIAKRALNTEGSSKNNEFVDLVNILNIKNVVHEIKKRSSILNELTIQGNLLIIGANYNIENGEVEFYD